MNEVPGGPVTHKWASCLCVTTWTVSSDKSTVAGFFNTTDRAIHTQWQVFHPLVPETVRLVTAGNWKPVGHGPADWMGGYREG